MGVLTVMVAWKATLSPPPRHFLILAREWTFEIGGLALCSPTAGWLIPLRFFLNRLHWHYNIFIKLSKVSMLILVKSEVPPCAIFLSSQPIHQQVVEVLNYDHGTPSAYVVFATRCLWLTRIPSSFQLSICICRQSIFPEHFDSQSKYNCSIDLHWGWPVAA